MAFSSYQNASPIAASEEDETPFHNGPWQQDVRTRRRNSLLLVGLLFLVGYLAVTAGYDQNSSSLRGAPLEEDDIMIEWLGSSHSKNSTTHHHSDTEDEPSPPDAPTPDWNGEGRYDWQKCQSSDDPDCWKNEGKRVHSYWKDFGQKMKTAWSNFQNRMRSFFSKPEEVTVESTSDEPTESSKH